MGKRPLGEKKAEQPKCLECGVVYKHHKFIGGSMILNVCNCNQNLLQEEADRILQKQIDRRNKK